jgi:ABC-type branched-subunit amino acid transport system substrate-binding protein
MSQAPFRVVAVLALFALVLAACPADDPDPDVEVDPEEVSYTLTLGAPVPFSGDIAEFGPPTEMAMQIAADIINETAEEMGLDVTVEIIFEDDQSDPSAGVEAATKLVEVDGVDMLIATVASAVTIPILESVAIPNRIVNVVPIATAPEIGDLEDDGFVFRTSPPDTLQGEALARVLADEFGADATVNVGTRNDAYGVALSGVFMDHWEEAGGSIGEYVAWDPDAPTFDTEAGQLSSGDPDGWVVIDFPATWARVGPSLVRTGDWDIERSFTTDALATGDLPETAGDEATEGMRGTAPIAVEGGAADAFDREWEERSDIPRHVFDVNAFDAIMVAFLATIAAGGTTDAETVKDHVIELTRPPGTEYTFEQLDEAIEALLAGEDIDYQGASGPLDLDDRGDPTVGTYEVWEFRDGAIESLHVVELE